MKDPSIEEKLSRLAEEINGPSLVESVLGQLATADIEAASSPSTWRNIMKNPWNRFAAASIILLVASLVILLYPTKMTPTAHAVEEILDAMERIQTVHFKAALYKQGAIECWMRFDDPAARPTHMSLLRANGPLRTVDTPEGSFVYNERTNRVFPKVRDERQKSWYLDFTGLFRKTLSAAVKNDTIVISEAIDAASGDPVIRIEVDEGTRECTYFVDATTKLPLRFTTTVTHDPEAFMKRTIAVKHIDFIAYNPPVPEGLFTIPTNAERVTNEHDITFQPGVGLQVDGLPPEEACVKLIRATSAALNAYDFETVEKLLFPFMAPPAEVITRIKTAAGEAPLMTLLELGTPYEKDGYWYVPTKSKEANGTLKDEETPIRFYEYEGHTYCRITWPD